MPLGRPGLSASQIDVVKAWVREGALYSQAPPEPPRILEATSFGPTAIEIQFSEDLDPVTAQDASRYLVGEGDLRVEDAQLVRPDRVHLVSSAQLPGVIYSVAASGVLDLSGQAIVAGDGDRASFSY